MLDQRALNDQPSALGPAKPLFLELARPSAVAPRLPAVPGDFAAEGAVELAPGKRVWPCGVEVWYEFVSADDERALIQRMREVGEWSAGAEKRLSVRPCSAAPCFEAQSLTMPPPLRRTGPLWAAL